MQGSDKIVDILIGKGVTDVFGIPGGVVLDFLYSLHKRKEKIKTHLNYHEQNSVFAASGFAKSNSMLGVAYATRGPGITNMVTGVADAYYDSVPLLIITGHSADLPSQGTRIKYDQEIDIVSIFSPITKYAVRIDDISSLDHELHYALNLAMNGRKGPVLLDISSRVMAAELKTIALPPKNVVRHKKFATNQVVESILESISNSSRPVLLLGDGFRGSECTSCVINFAEKNNIPILSSRFSQDLFQHSKTYYGYAATKGLRYSNYILTKSDLIVVIGHRLAFPIDSKSWYKISYEIPKIRIDIDKGELSRPFPNCINHNVDLNELSNGLDSALIHNSTNSDWLNVCETIRSKLIQHDIAYPVTAISHILMNIHSEGCVVSDVGNHEYWLCRASAFVQCKNPTFYSKSFGALGSSLGKSIGTFYSTLKPVYCFIGDQGLQISIQELQFIVENELPITIFLMNNYSSGMIRSREKVKYGKEFFPLHTTLDSGYSVPDFCAIAESYGIQTFSFDETNFHAIDGVLAENTLPKFIELKIDPTIELIAFTRFGDSLENMSPKISPHLRKEIERL